MSHVLAELKISIHAPTRGATLRKRWRKRSLVDFNPRSHKGSDGLWRACILPWCNFNPRSHKGSDDVPYNVGNNFYDFNPRSHKGSDLLSNPHISKISDFNPRSHKGSDCKLVSIRIICIDFNPRSHKGSDSRLIETFIQEQKFQSTLPQGERLKYPHSTKGFARISIHAPTRGATR